MRGSHMARGRGAFSVAGPIVRIHLPPAESLQTIGSSVQRSTRTRQPESQMGLSPTTATMTHRTHEIGAAWPVQGCAAYRNCSQAGQSRWPSSCAAVAARRNRERFSTRSPRAGVFTQPRSGPTPACVTDAPPSCSQGICRAARVVVNSRRSIFAQGGLPQPWPRHVVLPRSLRPISSATAG